MRLLLDTHSFLWFAGGHARLPDRMRDLIGDATNPAFLSVASLWEIAIKVSLGKLTLGQPFEFFIPEQLRLNQIELLPIAFAHVALVAQLPLHHRDPFDIVIPSTGSSSRKDSSRISRWLAPTRPSMPMGSPGSGKRWPGCELPPPVLTSR